MIKLEKGEVLKVEAWPDERYAELEVRLADGETGRALADREETGDVSEGDLVLLNVTAERLRLGSGGYHFVVAVMDGSAGRVERDRLDGHIMKLRYTSMQRSVLAVESPESPHHGIFMQPRSLEGMPVLVGEIHSMLPIAAAWLRYRARESGRRQPVVAYVMCEGGALPAAFSKHAAMLRRLGWVAETITYGHGYGGSIEAINKYTALIAARHVAKADVCIAVMGPGIAGTGTLLGHSGIEAGEVTNAAASLGGVPIMIPRISDADSRERHAGLSHHTLHTLRTAAVHPVRLPLPGGLDADMRRRLAGQLQGLPQRHRAEWIEANWSAAVPAALREYPARITTMGRSVDDDPAFFCGVCAAAEAAWRLCSREP